MFARRDTCDPLIAYIHGIKILIYTTIRQHPFVLLSQQVLIQVWGTCGPREHLIWPAAEFSSPKLRVQNHVKTKLHDKQVRRQ